jgi:hypothetical protein
MIPDIERELVYGDDDVLYLVVSHLDSFFDVSAGRQPCFRLDHG